MNLPKAQKIYTLLPEKGPVDFEVNLKKSNLEVDDDMILLDAGENLIEDKKWNEAIVLYEYYVRTFPNIVVAKNDLGDLYRMTNRKEKAIKCYQDALRVSPENPGRSRR